MNNHRHSNDHWRQVLTPEQYHVTREKGTEQPFTGKYVDNHEKGIYVCVNCKQPLFSSDSKFDSGTGWPSFSRPLGREKVMEKTDQSLPFQTRTEVLCSACEAHLGHVFMDGPQPTGIRFCVNSAALDFTPGKETMTDQEQNNDSQDRK